MLFRLPLGRKLVGGKLRVQFDIMILRGAGHGGYFQLEIRDLDQRVDYGWLRQIDIGPNFSLRSYQTKLVSRSNRYEPSTIGRIKPNCWQRIVVAADLDRKRYDLHIDGGRRAESVVFRDYRWFAGADDLAFRAGNVLLDNVRVHHLPGRGGAGRAAAAQVVPCPVIPAQDLGAAPVLDGRLDEPAWKRAYRTERFYLLTGEESDKPRTEVWVGYHADSLYLATRTWPKSMAAHRALRKRPGAPARWGHIEVFIDPSLTRRAGKYLHFGFDAAGNKVQEQGYGGHWDGDWQVATHRRPDHWTAEMRVDFITLTGACPPGDGRGAGHYVWGINVCRGRSIGPEYAAISPTYGNFHTPARFARLTGLTRAITAPMRCDLVVPDPLIAGGSRAKVRIRGGRRVAGVNLHLTVTGAGPRGIKPERSVKVRRGDDSADDTFALDLPVDTPGPYYFRCIVRKLGADNAPGRTVAKSQHVFTWVVPAGAIEARTDRNYYTHESIARIRGRLIGRRVPAGSTAVLQVRGGSPSKVLGEFRRTVGGSPFVAELPLANLPLGRMRLCLTLRGPDGRAILGRAEAPLVRLKPKHNEVKIRWDNVLLVDDQPFFPLCLWGNRDVVALSHELGCNTAFAAWPVHMTPQALRDARRRQLRFMGRPVVYSHPNSKAIAAAALRRYADDPAILGWFLEDEIPAKTVHEAPDQRLVDLANLLRRKDPYHPTYLNQMVRWTDNVVYGRVADVISSDPYAAYLHYNPLFVAEATRRLISATRGQRPVWQVLQVFHYPVTRTHPTPAEFRHSAYSAVVHGAKGIGLWGTGLKAGRASEDIRGLLANRALWHEVKRVVRALRRLSAVITSEETVERPAACANENVALWNKRWNGCLYVWLLNMRAAPERAVLRLPLERGKLINEIRPRGEFSFRNGRVELLLEPLRPVVLRVQADLSPPRRAARAVNRETAR